MIVLLNLSRQASLPSFDLFHMTRLFLELTNDNGEW